MDNFCLKWNNFETDIKDHFKKLKEEKKLFDATLVTEDGQHINTHKIILSAASQFFHDIFMKSDHTNIVIYLKGIYSAHLENIIDFIYNGEACIDQIGLKQFFDTGKDLLIKGLEGELQEVKENILGKQNYINMTS